jgi:hypothetical protein
MQVFHPDPPPSVEQRTQIQGTHTGVWSTVNPMPAPRDFLNGCVIGTNINVFGAVDRVCYMYMYFDHDMWIMITVPAFVGIS